ncbi:transcriptional regulator ATRX-like [Styela clava]
MSDYEYRSSRAASKNRKGGRINYAEPESDVESEDDSSFFTDSNEPDVLTPIKGDTPKNRSPLSSLKKTQRRKREIFKNNVKPEMNITNPNIISSSSGSESDIDEESDSKLDSKDDKKTHNGSRKRSASSISKKSKKIKDDLIETDSNTDDTNSDEEPVVEAKVRKCRDKKKKTKKERNLGRRKIKKILLDKDLQKQTRNAAKEERERLKRLEELEKAESEEEPDEIEQTPEKKILTSTVMLQKHPHVAVSEYIAQHLRPHQVEGVKFIWNNLVESTERVKNGSGSGCILAHCMGLGKTLQTISVIHTLLKTKYVPFECAMVVAPLNTVRNWIAEFVQWCEDGDELNLFNFAEPKTNKERVSMLRLWRKNGGVLILGYDMYRIMTTKIRYSGWKKTVHECLVDPGPDVVVCDEGHMLKNATSHISKQISKMRTKRRLVLTGTPLQNNLIEYHCMVDFVKPDLLGSLKEFRNRFVNPIINGQHIDSTDRDVKIMKKRSHVLHQMLQGFVQRKDYSCLKPYLSSKFEYVLKVRLTPLQIKLYQHYLDTMTNRGSNTTIVNSYGKGASLFADYQNLMRVWTHPKSLLLHTVQRDKMLARQAEWDFIAEELEASETDDWSNSSDEDDKNANENNENDSINKTVNSEKNIDSDTKKDKINNVNNLNDVDKDNSGDSSGSEEVISTRRTRSKRRKAVIKDNDEWDSDEASTEKDEDAESGNSSDDEESESDSESDAEKIPDRRTRSTTSRKQRYRLRCVESDAEIEFLELESTSEKKEPEWYAKILPEDQNTLENYQNSSKIAILFEILRLSEERKEKVLIFSQSLISLDLIEEMLKATVSSDESENEMSDAAAENTLNSEEIPKANLIGTESGEEPDIGNLNKLPKRTWFKNLDYFRMDGATQSHHRQKWINAFNNESDTRARLFLISTRAGSLGVNLVGANRVIIFDASWNPSHDTQSMFRVYRFGQTRKCYIYRLIAEGTMEEKIYQRQVNKQSLAFRVVDEQQINRHFTANSLAEMYTFNPTTPDIGKDEPTPIVPKDEVLADILSDPRTKYMVASYHEHDSLLDHQVDEELTEEERKAAWEEYEMIKKGHAPTISLQDWRQQSNLSNTQRPSSFSLKPMDSESSVVLLSRLSKMVANAFYQYQVCEVKSVPSIMKHLKETPLYSNSNEETIKAIAVEVNYRLELQRNEKFSTFQNLQRQFKQLQMQYFKQIGSGMLTERPAGQSSAVRIPTKDALLQHMASTSRTSSPTPLNGHQTSTTITAIEIIDDENETKDSK